MVIGVIRALVVIRACQRRRVIIIERFRRRKREGREGRYLEEEGRSLADKVGREEDLQRCVEIDLRGAAVLRGDQLLGEL